MVTRVDAFRNVGYYVKYLRTNRLERKLTGKGPGVRTEISSSTDFARIAEKRMLLFVSLLLGTLTSAICQTNYTGSWSAVPALTSSCPAVVSNYTLSALNPGSGSGTSNSYIPSGKTVIISFPGGFTLSTVSTATLNGTPVGGISTTANTISFVTPVAISKGAAISITINGITNITTAGNYQLAMSIGNATGGNNNFAASTSSQFSISPNASIALSASSGSNTPSVCINTPLTSIKYDIGGGGSGASVTGLPAGVTGSYNAGTFTISGTPTSAAGIYNYTVTTTGTCSQAFASGSITIKPDATIALTSGAGTNTQAVCANTSLTPITYVVGGGGTGVTVTGLPAGVNSAFNSGTLTLSGAPNAPAGVYTYSIVTTGTCNQATTTGTITVKPDAAITLSSTSGTDNQAVCFNSSITPITYIIQGGGTGAMASGLPTGITAAFNAGTYTITGTASALPGTYNYTITTTGTCQQATTTGVITIKPDATISLLSAPQSSTQTICANSAITDIVYSTGGSATGAVVSGLPAGINGVYNNGVFTISGSASTSGTYNYTVTTTGQCVQAVANGSITINPLPQGSLSSGGPVCSGSAGQLIWTASTGSSPFSLVYSDGVSNHTVTNVTSGVSFATSNLMTTTSNTLVSVTDINGCSRTSSFTIGNAIITAYQPPLITQQPGSETVCATFPVTFTVSATGDGLTYQWYKDGIAMVDNGSISGSTTSDLTVDPVTINDGGSYYVVVNGLSPCGTVTSENAILTVNQQIAISQQPAASQTVCEGNPVDFIVNASGTSLTYQWRKGTTNLSDGGNISGANTAQLNLSAVTTADAANNYNVVISDIGNVCPTAFSNKAKLVVNKNSTLVLSSAAATDVQTVCINTAIANIVYTAGGGATGANITGLPLGVSGTYNNGTITISGSPTQAGIFNYTVTTTGPCTNPSLGGTVTVNANATLTLTSAASTAAQTLCINNAILPITYSIGGSATGATVAGLPSGISWTYNAGVVTINGTPNIAGSFDYTVTATGPCNNPSITGNINVSANATIALTSQSSTSNQTTCVNTSIVNIVYSTGGSANGATVSGLPSGVAGVFNSGIFTISGTPTVAGTFPYTVITTGPCVNASANGTITVNANSTISLSSANNTQTVCINNPISSIVYNVSGGATGATVSNLPAGVIGIFSNGTLTISGTPTQSGTFSYIVTTTGPCVNPSLSGTITVNANSTLSLTSASSTASQSICINTPITAITYKVGGSGAGVTVTGLPTGVAAVYNAATKVVTLTGSPSVPGTFSYNVTTTGPCVNVSLSGVITVSPASVGGTVSPAVTPGCSGSASGTITLSGTTGNVIRWEYSNNGGGTWTTVANTTTSLSYFNLVQTTLYRAVVQSSPCTLAYSTNAVVTVTPAYPPTSVSANPAVICAGQTSTLSAASGYPDVGFTNGTFNQANPSGWCRDGQCSGNYLPADGDKQDTGVWRETNDHTFQGVYYSSTDYKFAIADGNFTSSIETPVFSLIGQTSDSLTFFQAYILQTTATKGIITISTDGGATYKDTLAKYSGVSSLGLNATKDTATMNSASIPLTNYLGLSNLRIKFTYVGSTASSWVLDNIQVPATLPITYQWTPTATLTPPTGIGQTVVAKPNVTTTYTITTMVGTCPAGSANITVTVNPLPTLTGISTSPVCEGNDAVISLTGLIPNSTSTITYNIAGSIATFNVVANGSGNGSFVVPVSSANDGQALTITSLSNSTTPCGQTFNTATTLRINKRPTAALSGDQYMCNGQPATLSVNLTGSAPWTLTYTDGTTSTTINNITTSPYYFNVAPNATATYSITALTDAQCTATAADLTGSATISVLSGVSGLWTGAVDKDWFNCRNWADGKVPTASVDVTIDMTAQRPCEIDAGISPYSSSYNYIASSHNITIAGNSLTFININKTDTLIATGSVTIRNDGTVDMITGGKIETWGNWDDQVTTPGNGFKEGSGYVILANSATQRIFASKGTELFYNLQINKSANASLVYLYNSVTVENDLTLTKGIFVTGYNLFTWNNTGKLNAPEPTYTSNSLKYTNSFIATCDTTGVPVNVANATTPFQGDAGFRIKNVGNVNTYFPVGASFKPSAVGEVPAPNRMMILNDTTIPQDFTVVVNIGDIGFTGSPVVERIWYVKSNGGKATMQLFFTKRYWTGWPSTENEVESGFDYSQAALIQKDYENNVVNLAAGSDIQNLLNVMQYPYNTEAYGIYRIGISNNQSDGIVRFNRFSIINPVNILVLPVDITGFRASKEGKQVRIDWTAHNEINVDHYDIQKSTDGVIFTTIATEHALSNAPVIDYHSYDKSPENGNNYYRIRIVEKDGTTRYTSIAIVSIDGQGSSLTIYPNPVTNKTFNVRFTNLPPGRYQLIMYGSTGQKVYSKNIENTGSSSESINVPSNVSAGAYFIKVLNDQFNFSGTIIIL